MGRWRLLHTFPFLLTSDIWDKFVEFESFVGDLGSVLKVEKRKTAALKCEVGGFATLIIFHSHYHDDITTVG